MKIERQFVDSLNDLNVRMLRNRREESQVKQQSIYLEVVYVSMVVICTPEHVATVDFTHNSIFFFNSDL